MKNFSFCLVVLAITLTTAVQAAENKLFFHLAGKDFTRAEAVAIAGRDLDDKNLQAAVIAAYPTAAALVLCSRSDIELSPEHTRKALQDSLQLLTPERRKSFESELKQQDLTETAWLDREAQKFFRQLNEALQRWSQKNLDRNIITQEQIQGYYYRNMDIFRRTQLNADLLWAFAPGDQVAVQKAITSLQQGMSRDAVRKKIAQSVVPADILEDLQSHPRKRLPAPHDKYYTVSGKEHLYLLEAGALKQFYLPLDEKLAEAISRALYDALAKALLHQKIQQEFAGKPIRFY